MHDALRWELDASLAGGVSAWVVEVHGLSVRDDGVAHAELERLGEELAARWRSVTIGDVEGIEEARRLYRRYGIDPTRTRPSSEALLRRGRKGQGYYRLNNVVDAGNWVSLEFLLPLGLYDRRRIVGGDVRVRLGEEGESYEGIRKGPVNVAGRLCVGDAEGAFGSPTSDSLRTSIRDDTVDVAAIVFAPSDGDPLRLERAGRALATRLVDGGGTLVVSESLRASA